MIETIVGKTIAGVRYVDPWSRGLTIVFTDGTKLRVDERMQAGEINVELNNEPVSYGVQAGEINVALNNEPVSYERDLEQE
jgi:hypothetical protein